MTDTTTRLRTIMLQHFALHNADPKLADFGSINLIDDLGADSLDMVELLMTVEEEFFVEITDAEAEAALGKDGNMPLSGLVELVERKAGERVL